MRRILSKLYVFATIMTTALFASCQQESDEVIGNINGLGSDGQVYRYTDMWDVLWKGYNQNYVGWENETMDWDKVNADTRPQLVVLDAKLDTLTKYDKLSPDSAEGKAIATEVAKLFHAAFDSLHDGHTWAYYKDRYTKQYEELNPNNLRLQQRKDSWEWGFRPYLFKDIYVQRGDIVPDSIRTFDANLIACRILAYEILPKMESDFTKLNPTTEAETDYKNRLGNCIATIEEIIQPDRNVTEIGQAIEKKVLDNIYFADIKQQYGLYRFNFNFAQMQMFFTKDNIAYFWLSSFSNWPTNGTQNYDNQDVFDTIKTTFKNWIDTWHDQVYKLHTEKKLKGVVLDVRGNGGGNDANLKNFAGLLFKGDKWQVGTHKFKKGLGRLDYTESTPFYFPCYEENSEDITEPIVILTNIASASCAELSTVAVKTHENGKSIGSRTAGAGAGLVSDSKLYPCLNYSGIIGIEGKTNVYAYIPYEIISYGGGIGSIECKGITPDIEVPLDYDLCKTAGRDTQFERALEYIRTGK